MIVRLKRYHRQFVIRYDFCCKLRQVSDKPEMGTGRIEENYEMDQIQRIYKNGGS